MFGRSPASVVGTLVLLAVASTAWAQSMVGVLGIAAR
jgi:hypothetical protein